MILPDTSTAGLVLIVARLCPDLWKTLDQAEIATLWDQCQSILQHLTSFSVSARKSLDLLVKVNEHVILKQTGKWALRIESITAIVDADTNFLGQLERVEHFP